jgi:hypothetical protein
MIQMRSLDCEFGRREERRWPFPISADIRDPFDRAVTEPLVATGAWCLLTSCVLRAAPAGLQAPTVSRGQIVSAVNASSASQDRHRVARRSPAASLCRAWKSLDRVGRNPLADIALSRQPDLWWASPFTHDCPAPAGFSFGNGNRWSARQSGGKVPARLPPGAGAVRWGHIPSRELM